jgi:hypothetical protein
MPYLRVVWSGVMCACPHGLLECLPWTSQAGDPLPARNSLVTISERLLKPGIATFRYLKHTHVLDLLLASRLKAADFFVVMAKPAPSCFIVLAVVIITGARYAGTPTRLTLRSTATILETLSLSRVSPCCRGAGRHRSRSYSILG